MKLKITVDGNVYEVEVEVAEPDPPHPSYVPPMVPVAHLPAVGTSAPAAAAPAPAGAAVVDESKVCRSPIAGVVARVSAQVGQTIQGNDVLVVLEAMKMETVITSPVAGKVARIHAVVGNAVQSGQVLVEFE